MERLQAAGSPMCRKAWWSSISREAASSACLQTGALLIPAITSFIRADASPPRHSRWWSTRCGIGVDRARSHRAVARLLVDRFRPRADIRLVHLCHPLVRRHLLETHRDGVFAVMQRVHDGAGYLAR